jgi:FkbM family methyltransferase
MIVWLASYPRSGNTALRTILHRAFGINTYSLYDDKGDIGSRTALREVVGHKNHSLDQQEFYKNASEADETYFVKTHEAPQDDAKAIYIVRDGRAAAVSYYHYLKDFWPEQNRTLLLKDVILGNCCFGSWSEHFTAWSPLRRPDTLVIDFNDIASTPARVVDAVATFIDRKPRSVDLLKFDELRKADPDFFRSGSDDNNIAEFGSNDLDLFWILHGELMRSLGYVDNVPLGSNLPQGVRRIIADLRERDQLQLEAALANSEADRVAKVAVIYERDATVATLQSEIARLGEALTASEADRAAQLKVIHERDVALAALHSETARLTKSLSASEAERGVQAETIRKRDAMIDTMKESRWWKLGSFLRLAPSIPDRLVEEGSKLNSERTIFDIGMHTGQDTAFYLAKGFRVVAVEANPSLVAEASLQFKEHIDSGRLEILNVGVGDREGSFPFYVNAMYSEWSSFDKDIGSRGGCKEVLEVPTVPFEKLLDRYGEPYYLKIDIEGHDFAVLERLSLTTIRPKFISVENGWPHMVHHLVGLGYDRFKFINQATVPHMKCPTPAREGNDVPWTFPWSSSGPFGEDTPGEWQAADDILVAIKAYWDNPDRDPDKHGWYDLHARLGEHA